ncbi:hypothetical protein CS369_14285 [Candidatus Symbiopectobacterium sp. 'North America']|nr:hypothetical protein [Candidatus Symbiopectobacterium sp. 'North America']
MATTIQLVLLFNYLNRADATSFAYKENSLSIVDNDTSLTKRNHFIENYPAAMSLADDGHVSSQSLWLTEREQGGISYANSSSTIFINENSHILCDDQKKNALISAIKHYLVSDGQLSIEEGHDFELSLKKWAKTGPLFITPLVESTDRIKRALMPEYDPRTAEHIKEHCAFEEEILNPNGENEEKMLLFQSYRAENPFMMILREAPRPKLGAPPRD